MCLKSDVETLSNSLESVELLKPTDTDDCTQRIDICAVVLSSNGSDNMSSSDKTVSVTDTCNNSNTASMMLEDSSISDVNNIVTVDEKYQINYAPAAESELTRSVWRKIKPHGGRLGATTMNLSEQGSSESVSSLKPALNGAGISNVISLSLEDSVSRNVAGDVCTTEMQSSVEHREHSVERADLSAESQPRRSVHAVADFSAGSHTDNVNTSHGDDKDVYCLLLSSASSKYETKLDAVDSDSSHCETSYDLTDNNVVTAHHLRDDIPDSELIDYSDDGSESLIDSSTCASVREQVRIFIALFDYDPATMSPNPDAVESELPFSEGQLIKVRFGIVCNSMHILVYFNFCEETIAIMPCYVNFCEETIAVVHVQCLQSLTIFPVTVAVTETLYRNGRLQAYKVMQTAYQKSLGTKYACLWTFFHPKINAEIK